MKLSGRTAVVTGGSKGIGFAIANAFAEQGMRVAILSSQKESCEKVAKALRDDERECIGLRCDVRDLASIREALHTVNSTFGSLDVVVNCAGILDTCSVSELTFESWDDVMNVNLRGMFFVIQEAIPYLKKSLAARIINISSNAGRMGGYENGLAYTASKGGIISLTYGLASRLAGDNITVNCIAPGTIATKMSAKFDEEALARLLQRFPLGRLGKPEEVAAAACYFASEEAAFTTGAVLDVNGGMFMG